MFLFLKLILAHLVADFILQFEELYQLKLRSRIGQVLHALVHQITCLAFVFPYLKFPFIWIFVTAISVFHYWQDQIKYALQKKGAPVFLCFTVDQIFHATFISSIFLFPASRTVLTPHGNGLWEKIYFDHSITLLAIAFVLTAFGGAYFLNALRRSFLKDSRPRHFITSFELSYGIVERTILSGIFLFSRNPLLLAASALIGLLRTAEPRLRNQTDFLLSFVYAACVGLLFRLWIP